MYVPKNETERRILQQNDIFETIKYREFMTVELIDLSDNDIPGDKSF